MRRGRAACLPLPATGSPSRERDGDPVAGRGGAVAPPCPLSRAGELDAAGAEVGDEGGKDIGEVLRRRRRDKELPR